MLYVVVWVGESVRCAAILRKINIERATTIEDCEKAVSVYESKEKLGRFFFSRETYAKGIWGFL